MKNKILLHIVLSMFCGLLSAQEVVLPSENPYMNLREGESTLINQLNKDDIIKHYKGTPALATLKSIMADKEVNRCATRVVSTIKNKLNLKDDGDLKEAILGLRLSDSIDDVAARILLKAVQIDEIIKHPLANNDLYAEEEQKALDVFKKEGVVLQNKSLCLEDAYRTLVSKLLTESLKFKKNLKHINKLALDHKLISNQTFTQIEKMRAQKVHEWPITLSSYASSLDSLAKKFPARTKETSAVITNGGKVFKKASLRSNLHEKYNSTQIILLANVVKDLKRRLNSNNIAIHINFVDQEAEIINLSPMEKFRFILKLLRKELALINNGSLVNGQPASYIDIITASYEVGYISAIEIEQLAALEEIWNPKKTTKEKVMFWVKTFGSVASVFLPPPFGFVSVLAIMMIDQQIADAPIDRDSDFNLL